MKSGQAIGYIIFRGEMIERDFNAYGWTVRDFADALDINMKQAYQLLSGEKIGLNIARKFIHYHKIDKTMEYIDWSAIPMAKNNEETIDDKKWY